MGEKKKKAKGEKMEEKKSEMAKNTAGKEEEKKEEEKKSNESAEMQKTEKIKDWRENKEAKENPSAPQEIMLKVYMHCEGCAREVRRSLKGFEGVEEVVIDYRTSKVIVKGEKADPMKMLRRVQRKCHRQVELLSPIPTPPLPEAMKVEEKENPKPEEKEEEPQIITVVLRVQMHCEACAQEIKKRILRMKEVESAEADLKNSEITVKGAFDPQKLVDYVNKRTGKNAVIVKQEPEKKVKKFEKETKEEKKSANGGEKEEEKIKEKKGKTEEKYDAAVEESRVLELKMNEYYYYPQTYSMEMTYAYPPQMFSDENPNACSVM